MVGPYGLELQTSTASKDSYWDKLFLIQTSTSSGSE